MSTEELLDHLRNRRFEKLIGLFESESLECKSQPYDLDSESKKAELAKDVSSLMNAKGGVILLGYSTSKALDRPDDQIAKFRPIPTSQIEVARLNAVLASAIYPAVDFSIQIFPTADENSCAAAIVVSQAVPTQWPVLVRKALDSDKKSVGYLFGFFERKGAHTIHLPVERFHGLLREGLLHQENSANIGAIFSQLTQLRAMMVVPQPIIGATHSSPEPVLVDSEEASQPERVGNLSAPNILRDAVERAGLSDRPAFVISCRPESKFSLTGIFEGRSSPLVQAIDDPPELRYGGFDLSLGGNSRIVGGNRRASVLEGFGILEVHESGMILYAVAADESGLSWGRQARQQSSFLLNQLALAEKIYLFAKFASNIFAHEDAVGDVTFSIALLHGWRDGNPPRLEGGPLSDWASPEAALDTDSIAISLRISSTDISKPEVVAERLLKRFYNAFGHDNSRVPYLKPNEEGGGVDVALIAKGGRH